VSTTNPCVLGLQREKRRAGERVVLCATVPVKLAGCSQLVRIRRLAEGNAGDVKAVSEGVSEMRIDYGPGYRVYFTKQGREIIVLLVGGDKRTQSADIKAALRLAHNL